MELFMKSVTYILTGLLLLSINNVYSQDWSNSAELPGNELCIHRHGHDICFRDGDRRNIFSLSETELAKMNFEGAKHVQSYPVEITELQVPFNSMEIFFKNDEGSVLRRFFNSIAQEVTNYKSINDLYKKLGLHKYPKTYSEYGPNLIPNMGELEDHAMGATILGKGKGRGLTFSCAACHSANLFGQKVVGLTNRFPGSNEFFHLGQRVIKKIPAAVYKTLFKASKEEIKLFKTSKAAVSSVGIKKPIILGLDTSLAQVGLSLAKRNTDEYATISKKFQRKPRKSGFDKKPADSKPAVWWNVKYKTKWLSDASIDSGNPIHTNFLWNEIGRGINLKNLESWLLENQNKVDELTSFVFNTTAPKYNDFFPRKINIAKAKKGEKIFRKTCSGCHGIYEKGWSDSNSDTNTIYENSIETTKVWYHKKTPTIDIGTDPLRYEGISYMAEALNNLKISKSIKTVVTPKIGYVPPPLVGIWSRWPYFHNNSAPTLYDVITPDFKRPVSYIAVESINADVDFDSIKNGYPSAKLIREPFKSDKKYFYNTKIEGLSNMGHTKMLINDSGEEILTENEKLNIIEFLKTL